MLMMEERKMKRYAVLIVVGFCCLIIALSLTLNILSAREQRNIITDSIRSQLLSTCYAARELLNEHNFSSFEGMADVEADEENYIEMREELRDLAEASGAEYIYALRYIGGEAMFVVDSDPEEGRRVVAGTAYAPTKHAKSAPEAEKSGPQAEPDGEAAQEEPPADETEDRADDS
mgnify:CR=1 FL=1